MHHAKVTVEDSFAFLATYRSGAAIYIIDYSIPSAPKMIGTYGDSYTFVVAVDGDIMYTERNSDLHVVDVHDPRNPVLLGMCAYQSWAPVVMVPHRGYLYATDMYGNTAVFDVSNPTDPLYIENFRTPSENAEKLLIVDNTVFLADNYALMIAHTPYGAPPARSVCLDIKPGPARIRSTGGSIRTARPCCQWQFSAVGIPTCTT